MTMNLATKTEKEVRNRIVDDTLGVMSFCVPLYVLILIYNIVNNILPAWFYIIVVLMLLFLPFFMLRQRITFAIKLGLLLLSCAVGVLLTMANAGLVGNGPLALAICNVFAISLFGKKYFDKIVGLTILLLTLAVIAHYLDLIPQTSGQITSVSALIGRTTSVVVLFSVLLLVHSRLMQRLSQLSEESEWQNQQLRDKNRELEDALSQVENLENMLSVCAWCKKVKESPDSENWISMDQYVEKQKTIKLSHGLCNACYAENLQEITDAE